MGTTIHGGPVQVIHNEHLTRLFEVHDEVDFDRFNGWFRGAGTFRALRFCKFCFPGGRESLEVAHVTGGPCVLTNPASPRSEPYGFRHILKGETGMQAGKSRWFWVVVAFLAVVLVGPPGLAKEKQPPEGKVAVVNGSVITLADFDREMGRVQQRLFGRGKPPGGSQLSEIKKEVLENLINHELIYQESQKKGITIDEAAVDEQMKKWKGRFSSEAEFKSWLSKENLSEAAIESRFKRNMAIQQFIDKEFVQRITVSDEESKTYYDSNPDLFKQPEQVRARHILIKVDSGVDESQKVQARKKMEKIQEKVRKGEDFAALAKESSEGPSSARGGDLGYFRRGQMAKSFEEAAFTLRPGEVSDIVETEFGYHVIKVIDKKPETTIAYDDIKDRLEKHLKREKVRKEVRLHVEKLKEKAKVERFLSKD
jgi:peptidyl-prolyl cis-trans isomerase C